MPSVLLCVSRAWRKQSPKGDFNLKRISHDPAWPWALSPRWGLCIACGGVCVCPSWRIYRSLYQLSPGEPDSAPMTNLTDSSEQISAPQPGPSDWHLKNHFCHELTRESPLQQRVQKKTVDSQFHLSAVSQYNRHEDYSRVHVKHWHTLTATADWDVRLWRGRR